MDKTQRQIMLVMPLFFVIFIINFPAGVIVYWITTNTWTIGQQYVVKRRIGPMGPPATATATADGGGGGGPPKGSGRLGRLRRFRQGPELWWQRQWQRRDRRPVGSAQAGRGACGDGCVEEFTRRSPPAPAPQEEEALGAPAMSEATERVHELLERVATEVGVDTSVEVREDPDGISAEFVGDDLGLLIGHHGQTIDAIQHLAYRIAYRGAEDRKRVEVDAPATASVAPSPSAQRPTRRPRRPSRTGAPWLSRR